MWPYLGQLPENPFPSWRIRGSERPAAVKGAPVLDGRRSEPLRARTALKRSGQEGTGIRSEPFRPLQSLNSHFLFDVHRTINATTALATARGGWSCGPILVNSTPIPSAGPMFRTTASAAKIKPPGISKMSFRLVPTGFACDPQRNSPPMPSALTLETW